MDDRSPSVGEIIPVEDVQQSEASVDGGDVTAPASLIRAWVGRLNNDLQNLAAPVNREEAPTATIFRVPIFLREVSVQRYVAKFYSFGLYRYDAVPDYPPDGLHLDFVGTFMTITEKSWNEVVEMVGSPVSDWVKLYGDFHLKYGSEAADQLSTDDIKTLLALDSVFVASFIQAYHQCVCRISGESSCPALPLLNQVMDKDSFGRPPKSNILLDMFKFENQIPLGLLEKYVNELFSGVDTSEVSDPFTKFLTDSVDLIYCDLPGPSRSKRFSSPQIWGGLRECKHLLHCLYLVICYKRRHDHHTVDMEAYFKSPRRKRHRPRVHTPTVTQLKEAGISVKVGDTLWVSDVHFRSFMSRGTLYIPAFSVYEETEVLLRNLLMYEVVVEKKSDLWCYIQLMTDLIKTEEDVKLLRESGVLENNNLGGDLEVAKMWKTILPRTVIVTMSPGHSQMIDQIADHYESKYNRWAAELFGEYFRRRPWLLGGLAFILLTGTLSTVYTVLSYYK